MSALPGDTPTLCTIGRLFVLSVRIPLPVHPTSFGSSSLAIEEEIKLERSIWNIQNTK
jgi:hypothetical protein